MMKNINYIGLLIITIFLASISLSANSGGGQAKAEDNVIYPPYTNTFDDNSALDGYVNINNNNEGARWTVLNEHVQMLGSEYDEMDSWLITPGIMLEDDQLYEVSLDARVAHSLYPERIEVYAGNSASPESMSICIIDKTDVTSTTYTQLRGYLKVGASGVYYIGLHGCSDIDSYFLCVDNLSIKAGTPTVAPDQVVDLKVTPHPLGELSADISFTTPNVDIDGNKLSAITKVEVMRGGNIIKTFDNPGEGVTLTHKDVVEKSGTYAYTVVCYNEAGRGKETVAEAFIGISIPATPKNAKVEETSNLGEVKITWTAPTTDYEGRPINPDLISYTIVDGFTRMTVDEGVKGTEYIFNAISPDNQDFVQYGIFASTSAGTSEIAAMTSMLPVGKAYSLPVEESFANGDIQNDFVWGNAADDGSEAWLDLLTNKNGVKAQDGDNGYVGCFSYNNYESANLYSGKINVSDAKNPILSFYYYKFKDCENKVTVLIDAGNGPIEADSYVCGPEQAGWTRAIVPLSEYRNKEIRINFHFTNISHSFTVIDNIAIFDQREYDIAAVSINVPMNVKVCESAILMVNVVNNGTKDVDDYLVKLYCNGEVVQTYPGMLLESGKNEIIAFEEKPSLDSKAERIYYAEVTCQGDEVPENNLTPESKMFVILPSYPVPSGLKANVQNNDIALVWDGPNLESMPAEPITDNVEQYESFAVNSAGDWAFIDKDLGGTYGFSNMTFPNEESPMAWMVFDNTDIDDTAFDSHSGSKFFASMASTTPPNDDWLISPELDGHAQTVSFYAKAVDYYEESFEFLYSTTGTSTDDFNLVAEVTSIPDDEWVKYSYLLPEGAKHFAIRCTSNDALGLFVDDLTFAAADGKRMELKFKGYNVYRDGVKLTSTPIMEKSYTDEGAAFADYKYFVTAMYDKGESAASNIATSSLGVDSGSIGTIGIKGGNGCIIVTDASGSRIEVCTIDGISIFSGTGSDYTRINVAGGIYIVKAGNRVVKVAVK